MALPKDLYNQVNRYTSYRVDYNGINLLALSQIFVFELSLKRLEGKGILNKLKKYSLENYVKAVISIFTRNGTKIKKSKYLFVNDVYNNSMVQNIRAVQKKFDEDIIELVADKRLVGKNSKLVYRYFKPFTFLVQLFGVYRLFQNNTSTLNSLCAEFKIKRRFLALNLIDSLFILNCATNFLKSHEHFSHNILNTDVHKLSKAIVFMAKKKKTKTYVIQHGSTVLEYGYLPVIADFMLTWGKLSNNWFIERGTSKNSLIALGTPKMDGFVNYDKSVDDLQRVQNVLLVLNPIGDDYVRTVLQIIKEAGVDMEYNLKIKLHPGSIDNKGLVEEIFEEPQVEILKLANTHELIHKSDVIITTTSTVGNETIAFNKPLVQIKIIEIQASMEYEKFDCSHIIGRSKELKMLLRDAPLLESKKVNYPQFIFDYFYSLDGRSSERISNFIKNNK